MIKNVMILCDFDKMRQNILTIFKCFVNIMLNHKLSCRKCDDRGATNISTFRQCKGADGEGRECCRNSNGILLPFELVCRRICGGLSQFLWSAIVRDVEFVFVS